MKKVISNLEFYFILNEKCKTKKDKRKKREKIENKIRNLTKRIKLQIRV